MHQWIKTRFDWMTFGNRWFWFHSMGGAVGAKLFILVLSPWSAFALVAIVALVWEMFEYFIDVGCNPDYVYGSRERWFYDSLGDVLGAVLMALVVVI